MMNLCLLFLYKKRGWKDKSWTALATTNQDQEENLDNIHCKIHLATADEFSQVVINELSGQSAQIHDFWFLWRSD